MLLSLWNIANSLYPLDVELGLNDDSCKRYSDAGGLYISDGRLQLVHSGTTGYCLGTNGQIIVKNISNPEFFYLIRYVFHYYSKWENAVISAVRQKRSFWDIMNISNGVLGSPGAIFSDNLNVLALNTPSYISNSICKGLKELRNLGSMNRLQKAYFLNAPGDTVYNTEVWMCEENNGLPRSFNVNLIHNSRNNGVLTLFEGQIPLNQGHREVIEHLAFLISEYYNDYMEFSRIQKQPFKATVSQLLSGAAVTKEELTKLRDKCHISPKSKLCLVTIGAPGLDAESPFMNYFTNYLENTINSSISLMHENRIVCLLSGVNSGKAVLQHISEVIKSLRSSHTVSAGISLTFFDIEHLSVYYKQCLLAMKYCSANSKTVRFFDKAVDILLTAEFDRRLCRYFVHPGMAYLHEYDLSHGTDYCITLQTVLQCERNMTAAAAALYIHRNTLIYRMQKIYQIISPDFDNAYEREYTLISLRIINLMGGRT